VKKLLVTTVAACVLFSGAAFAFGDIVLAPPAKEKPDRGNGADDHPFPFDAGRMNESPIRGAGRISVVHNEPPTESAESKITAARWLLQDNGYQCSMPRRR
jgi:hypothetical protein